MTKESSTGGRRYRSAEEYLMVNYPPDPARRPRSGSRNEERFEHREPISAHITKIAEAAKRVREREPAAPL